MSDIFEGLKLQINSLDNQITGLNNFMKYMVDNSSEFDSEDKQTIQMKLTQMIATRDNLQRNLLHRQKVYEEQVSVMQNQLNLRQQKLESFDTKTKFFASFPDVLEFFAKKQATMSNKLEQVKSNDPLYARERERLLIRTFNTFYCELNKEP